MFTKAQINWSMQQLMILIPNAQGALKSRSPFELLVAVMLSAQTTDAAVNKITPQLFADFPTISAIAAAPITDLEQHLHSIGLYHTKAQHLKAAAQKIMTDFNGEVPSQRAQLESLPGVGRKTADVVLGDAFGQPAIAVDTHVNRIAKRWPIVSQTASVREVENTLMAALPPDIWVQAHHTLILFGRQYCTARKPKCALCPLKDICASAAV